jgi:YHS domain-containing protein
MQTKSIFIAICVLGASFASAQHEQHHSPQSNQLTCPVLGEAIPANAPSLEYAGLKVTFCCAGCDEKFAADPSKYLKQAADEHKTVAISLFDPVNGDRIDLDKAAMIMDFQGVRYPFVTKENHDEFMGLPGLYTQTLTKESLTCPVMKNEIMTYSAAVGFADFKGVRFYFCCAGCPEKFKDDSEKYYDSVSDKVRNVGSTKDAAPSKGQLTMAPTCAGCAGEARLLNGGNFAGHFMASYRFIAIDDVKARNRFTLDYAVTPRLTIGLERSGSDTNPNPVPKFTDNPSDYLRFSDGDALILPRFSWFISPEAHGAPSLLLGSASDRLSTPVGQALFLTASKHIPNTQFTPFISIKTNSYDGRTVFPFGVNYALPNNYVIQAINDGDYTHLLFTKMMDRAAVSLVLARTKYIGLSVTYGF